MLKQGIYEQIINREIEEYIALENTKLLFQIETSAIDEAEAAGLLAHYVADLAERRLKEICDRGGNLAAQLGLVNQLIGLLDQEGNRSDLISSAGKLLLSVTERKNHIAGIGSYKADRPVTSIAQSSLFTGTVKEPSMFMEIKKEIVSADRIDILVSFIKWSGLRLIYEELQEFTQRGQLRVITTSYMGATDLKAVEKLHDLPNTEIKINYDISRTRLHAKAYVFFRDSGFTTAYIGSSNLTNAALSSGLEWNVKVADKDLPTTVRKVAATFETYWNDKEFQPYDATKKPILRTALESARGVSEAGSGYFFEIRPYDYQLEILDKLQAERSVRKHYRNLIVAATGTGKTVIAAFDYKRFCSIHRGKINRLLFIAHREEILKQSLNCFRGVLQNQNFGDLFFGAHEPQSMNHLFLTIQTFHSREFWNQTSPDFYDYIIVDETHHGAAATYRKLLDYYQPQIFLGLTATPERLDNKSILEWFDNRIAAEIRLPAAIERKLLCPFQYFGITDNVDLRSLKWNGGYVKSELEGLYTADTQRARLILCSIKKYITDMKDVKGLGFCVTVAHAEFMARYFRAHNVPSQAVTADSPGTVREKVKQQLVSGEISFIFVVDLYNEGIDIPEVNTILFLRPTESLTVFLQQLGRGLRLHPSKECLTVLDFIGQAHAKYNFADKFAALLTRTQRSIDREIADGFLHVPRGSYIHLEKMAKDYILNNIKQALRSVNGLIARIAAFTEDTGQELSYSNFINLYHLDLRSLYPKYSFARLCVKAGVRDDFTEAGEEVLTKALARLSEINSRRWIEFLQNILPRLAGLDEACLSQNERTMLYMLYYTIYQKPLSQSGAANVVQGLDILTQSPVMRRELLNLLDLKYEQIDFIDQTIHFGKNCSLDLYCSYTRDQLLTALGYYTSDKLPPVQAGVLYLPDLSLDVFLITLNKSDKDYSPSTLYDDYSIGETLFHWQSQSTTSAESPTGQRYIHHKARGSQVALFVREYKSEKGIACPYTFLGLADYVSHTSSKPMNIIWQLHHPIPAKFLRKTNKLVVG